MKHIGPGISVSNIASPTTASINVSSSIIISGSITIGDEIIFEKGANFTSSWAINSISSSYVNSLNQNVLITGSLDISNQNGTSPLLIKSGSSSVLVVTGSGVTVLGTFVSPPPAVAGGIYFDGTDFYFGF